MLLRSYKPSSLGHIVVSRACLPAGDARDPATEPTSGAGGEEDVAAVAGTTCCPELWSAPGCAGTGCSVISAGSAGVSAGRLGTRRLRSETATSPLVPERAAGSSGLNNGTVPACCKSSELTGIGQLQVRGVGSGSQHHTRICRARVNKAKDARTAHDGTDQRLGLARPTTLHNCRQKYLALCEEPQTMLLCILLSSSAQKPVSTAVRDALGSDSLLAAVAFLVRIPCLNSGAQARCSLWWCSSQSRVTGPAFLTPGSAGDVPGRQSA